VKALDTGGALLHGFYAKHINPDGTTRNHVFVNNESWFSIDGSADGSVWAFTGNVVRIMDNVPAGENYRISGEGSNMITLEPGVYVGRYPRVVRVSPDGNRIAVGTSDGTFALLDREGTLLWEQHNGASYVTDILFLPGGDGVAFARDIFDYQHDNYREANHRNGWRYRDVVEAYTLDGDALWRHEGVWRESRTSEPFMTQFALSSDVESLAVLSGEQVRLVDLNADPVANSTLYAVEDPLGSGAKETTPIRLQDIEIVGPARGAVNAEYTFTAAVQPDEATTPITYTWKATGQSKRMATVNSRSYPVTFSWATTGTKRITVTAVNAISPTALVSTVSTLPVQDALPPDEVTLSGENVAHIEQPVMLAAQVQPDDVTLPLTYRWYASGQPMQEHAGRNALMDELSLTWGITGTQTVTVTVSNAAGMVTSAAHTLQVTEEVSNDVYLPLVRR
jgi:hypothetical protein